MTHPHRMLANNSAVYINKPTNEEFLKEWMALVESRSGERGIFNRGSLALTLPARRIKVLKTYKGYFDPTGNHIIGPLGTNPCGEIILQSKQFCNLSEIVARAEDTEKTLLRKMRIAVILGTYQSTLTHFPYLSKEWRGSLREGTTARSFDNRPMGLPGREETGGDETTARKKRSKSTGIREAIRHKRVHSHHLRETVRNIVTDRRLLFRNASATFEILYTPHTYLRNRLTF